MKTLKIKIYLNYFVICLLFLLFIRCNQTKHVVISTSPAGADVLINDLKYGITPYVGTLVFKKSFPTHRIKLKLEGYYDTNFVIQFYPREQTNFNVSLNRKMEKVITLVDFQPVVSDGQAKLQKVTKSTIAYLETIESSSSVKTVQRVTINEDPNFYISGPVLAPNGKMLL
ncbi:MAG: PEGA domain-containing protein [Bacteroidetes bacterium]|nr:PEGA domain-containing protein [Bacteroidota bacterium]